jgi:predicted nuclease with RNAse H fold
MAKLRRQSMPKKQAVSKAQAVRDYLKVHPQAKSSEIAEALGKQGIEISAVYVAGIKSAAKKRRRAVKVVREKRGVSITEIKAALALIKVAGSVGAAGEALSAAEEIQAMMV